MAVGEIGGCWSYYFVLTLVRVFKDGLCVPCYCRDELLCLHTNDDIPQAVLLGEDWEIPAVSGCKHHGQ